MRMLPEYDVAEGWASVEVEFESGARQWYVMRDDEVDNFIKVENQMGHAISDVDRTTQYAAAEAYAAVLYLTDETVREAVDARRRTNRIFGRPKQIAPIPEDVVTHAATSLLEDIVAELKRREGRA